MFLMGEQKCNGKRICYKINEILTGFKNKIINFGPFSTQLDRTRKSDLHTSNLRSENQKLSSFCFQHFHCR